MRSPLLHLDVARLLDRLGIVAKRHPSRATYEAVCPHPDHADRTPSWFIRDQPGEPYHACHKCLSCGFSGGPTSLVEAVLGWMYWGQAARDWLLDGEAPPPIPDVVGIEHVPAPRRRRTKFPEGVRFWPFEEWPPHPTTYLVRGRGFEPWQVDYWGLGFIPATFVAKDKDEDYAGRIVIPFRNSHGDVLGWTARAWSKLAEKRYKEPSAKHQADPGAVFGEARWQELDSDACVLAEGAFDAMAVHRAMGDDVGVAAFAGSSPNGVQINKVAARFKRVVIFRDPGDAGMKAADVLNAALGRHVRVRTVCADVDAGELGETSAGLGTIRAMVEGALE